MRRRCQNAKTASRSSPAPTRIGTMPHALGLLSSNVPAMMRKKPAAESTNPTTSRSRQPMVGGDSVSRPEPANMTTTMTASSPKPTRQLRNVVRKPPKRGPTVAATAPMAAHRPKANARSSPSYAPEMVGTNCGVSEIKENTTSVYSLNLEDNFMIYPNPAQNS